MVTGGGAPVPAKAGAAAAVATTGTAHTPVRTTARLLGLFITVSPVPCASLAGGGPGGAGGGGAGGGAPPYAGPRVPRGGTGGGGSPPGTRRDRRDVPRWHVRGHSRPSFARGASSTIHPPKGPRAPSHGPR